MDNLKLCNPMLTHYELLDKLACAVTPHQVLRGYELVHIPQAREGQIFENIHYFRKLELYRIGFIGRSPSKECPWIRGTSVDLAAALMAFGGSPTFENYRTALSDIIEKMVPDLNWMKPVWRNALMPMARWAWLRGKLVFELEYGMDNPEVFQNARKLLRKYLRIKLPSRVYKGMSLAYGMWGSPVGLQILYMKNKKAVHECIPLHPYFRYGLGGDYHRFDSKKNTVILLFDDYIRALPVFQGSCNVFWLYENFRSPRESPIWTPNRATYVMRDSDIPEAIGYLQEQGCIMSLTKLETHGYLRKPSSYRRHFRNLYPTLKMYPDIYASLIDRENLKDIYTKERVFDPTTLVTGIVGHT